VTLETLLDYAAEQQITDRRLAVQELFAPTTLDSIPSELDCHVLVIANTEQITCDDRLARVTKEMSERVDARPRRGVARLTTPRPPRPPVRR